ncbi:MAG: WG repeat-containing protein [Clostridiales bacterium]|nr:WG repeat-containing protein [Clostridiales bacterium]
MKKNIILLLVVLLGLSWYVSVSEMITQPKKVEEHLKKAENYEKKGIYVDAVAEYEEALKYRKDDPEISVRMAQDYLATGETKKFVSVCQQTAEANQEDTTALNLLMEYYVDNGYQNKAVKYLSDFTETYPENENAQAWMLELKGTYTTIYCRYKQLAPFVNNTMVVSEEGRYGIASSTGTALVEPEYEEAHPFSADGFALVVREDGTYAYLDQEGQTRKVPDSAYKDLGMLSEDRAPASKDGKFGYLDENMEEETEFQWDALTAVKDKVGAAQKDGKWALVGRTGKEKTEYLYDDVIIDENGFCSGQERIFVKEDGSFHMVNRKGKTVGEETFDDAKVFGAEGYAAVCRDGKWGFVDANGKLVIDYAYDDACSFSNGFAAVCQDGKWGYIDTENHMVLEPGFVCATSLSDEGTAAVKLMESENDEWQLIQLNLFL